MASRIDLSFVFDSALSPRHAIPHRVLTLSAEDPFACYLDSDDTRLPSHPSLAVAAVPAEEYDTYTGEDDWRGSLPEDDNATPPPPPRFDRMVRWVAAALEEISDGDGVVLCGRRVVADDCPWAVLSRTPALQSPRDVFMAMRSSGKFLWDLHGQRQRGGDVVLALARALGGRVSQEFRVFVPYRFTADGEVPVADWTAAGISQRATDVCVPELMSWDEPTHEENFAVVLRHVRHARLMERAAESDGQFVPRLTGALPPRDCVALLAVDIVFDGPSLPVRVLSAKARGFRARDAVGGTAHICEEDEGDTTCARDAAKDEEDEEDGNETASCEADAGSFFRLFRDATNWNRYVDVTQTKKRRFFVIASESSDLMTVRDTLTKSGMPLELLHPELLKGSKSSNNEWHERLMQCIAAASTQPK